MNTNDKHRIAKKVGVGVGLGAAAAGASAMYSNQEQIKEYLNPEKDGVIITESGTISQEWEEEDYNFEEEENLTLEDVKENITPDFNELSFGEAFRMARSEHGGGGGVFCWHDKYYHTYTREEYNQLDEKDLDALFLAYKEAANGDTEAISNSLAETMKETQEDVYTGNDDNDYFNEDSDLNDYGDSELYADNGDVDFSIDIL